MRTYFVVMASPRLDNDLRFGTRTKPFLQAGGPPQPICSARADGLARSPVFCGDFLHDLDLEITLGYQLL